jgi:hypothetical protein
VGSRPAAVLVACAVALGAVLVAPPVSATPAPVAVVAPAALAVPAATTGPPAAEPLPEPQTDPATSRQRADEILARPEFRPAQPSLTSRVTRWLGDLLGRLVTRLFDGGVGSALAWGILALVVAGVVFLITRVTRTMQPDPVRGGATMTVEVHRTPTEWRREAEACEARGAWKDGLRCRYRGLIADLVARGVVRDLVGRTTGEYRADVAAELPAAAADFAGASELFERAWYGDRPTGPDQSARFRALADHVVAGAGHRSRAAAAEVEVEVPA